LVEGFTDKPLGFLPTGIATVTVIVLPSITDRVLDRGVGSAGGSSHAASGGVSGYSGTGGSGGGHYHAHGYSHPSHEGCYHSSHYDYCLYL
jgi:uncharacterized membrane protein